MLRRAAVPLLLLAAACSGGKDATGPVPVASVSVSAAATSIAIGATTTVTATTRDANGNVLTGRTISFTSGATGVATVSSSGTVTGVAAGAAVITATSEGKSGTVVITVAASAASCDGVQPLTLTNGQVQQLTGGSRTTLCVSGGTSGAEYALIPVNTSASRLSETVSLAAANTSVATGLPAAASLMAAQVLGLADPSLVASAQAVEGHMPRDYAFEATLRAQTSGLRAAALLRARASGITRTPRAAVVGLTGSTPPAIGSIVTLNASVNSACGPTSTPRPSRVVAVSNSAIIVEDTLRPAGGFTATDYQNVAATFDTLVFALDTTSFGAPADIDQNGRIVLFFTPAVNALTAKSSTSVIEGFFYERDLYPHTANASVGVDCPTSNEAEMFYLPVVDPNQVYNGFFTSKSTLVSDVIGTTIHEFQHLINASRRFYVTTALVNDEEDWLNEAMSHLAQEILYLHVAGLTPKSDLTFATSTATGTRLAAMQSYESDNLFDFSSYLSTVETSTAYAPTDPQVELTTRGAACALLRYALDQSPNAPETYLRALVNATTEGIPNFNTVFSSVGGLAGALRGAAVANFTDDAVGVTGTYTYPTWNYRDWLPHFTANSSKYPLTSRALPGGSNVTIALVPGGSSVVRFRVAGGATGAIAVTFSGAGGADAVDLMLVRTQ
ncbi:MAG TPA: Ig-like domain-containing protein [Gemmatimonadaceae bacterium]|nr:Ig-like domain-containing protein [Gemmatimonadaceae bacterium]